MVVLMWTLEMEFALLTSMLESVRNGLRAESGFKKEAWKTAIEDVKNVLKVEREVTVDQLKTKFQWYNTKWKEWSIIKKNSGWGWDDDTELFLASDSEWDLHIKNHLEAKSLRYNTLTHHEILSELYARVIASGKEALSIHQALHRANDPVSGQSDQHAEDNELDSQEESDNEFVMREEEVASLAKSLLDCDTGTKHISQDVTANIPSSYPQRKQRHVRLMSTITKNKHETSVFKPRTTRMRSTSPARKRLKITWGHKIAESIQDMVEELKKAREKKTGPTPLDKAIKLLVSRYGSQKDLLSNGLKLMKDDRNVGIFLALDENNQKTWLEEECNALNTS